MLFVQGASRGAVSDALGRYRIAGLAAGRHTLVAQRVGLATERRFVEVTAGAIAKEDFTLREAATLVAPVIVSATREWQRRTEASATIDVLDGAEVRRTRASHPSGIMNRISGVH